MLIAVVAATLLTGFANGQTSARSEDAIRAILETGATDGHYIKEISPMGDAAAVAVTRVLAGKTLTTTVIDNVLVILGYAFADPRMVKNVPDRQPRTALFVLQSLASSASDPDVEKRIAQRKQYVMERYEKSMQGSSQK